MEELGKVSLMLISEATNAHLWSTPTCHGWQSSCSQNVTASHDTIPLPIPLSSSYLLKLQATVNRFIWNRKKPRFKYSILYRPKINARVGVPNLKVYHQLVILDQLKLWLSPLQDHVWCPIDHSLLGSSLYGTFGAMLSGFTPQASPYSISIPLWCLGIYPHTMWVWPL